MPVKQKIKWVVLPAGVTADGQRVRASVFVAPRLGTGEVVGGDPNLAPFMDFHNWPAQTASATFVMECVPLIGDDPAPVFAVPGTRVGDPASNDLWRALFNEQTPVKPFTFDDHSQSAMQSFSAREVGTSTRGAFSEMAARTPDRMPTSGDMTMPNMAKFVNTSSQGVGPGLAADDQPGMASLRNMVGFYQRPKPPQGLAGETPPPEQPMTKPDLDFHQMLSVLGDHPILLRRLGLVIDLEFPAPPAIEFGGVAIRIRPEWNSLLGENNQNVLPLSRFRHRTPEDTPDGRRRFTRASDLGELAADAGLKVLPEEHFSLEQADIDGTALKLIGMDPAAAGALPAVRSGGIALVRDGRTDALQADFTRATEHEQALAQNQLIELSDDDLIRGHRLDIFDEAAGRWRSLHERKVEYKIPGFPTDPVQDEGFFQISLPAPDMPGAQARLHDQVISWTGWSLSASRPGKVLPTDPRAPDPTIPETALVRPENAIETAMPLQIETSVRPGSLPRLRFGRRYQVRVRTVDLAGNGPGLDEDLHLTPEALTHYSLPGEGSLTYQRFEPVPAPELIARQEPSDGAAPDRMVIRTFSEPGEIIPDERHVVLPKAALELIERHGLLDEAIGSASEEARSAVYEIARREKGELGKLHPEEQIAPPYLFDPLAHGVIFFGLPGLPENEPFSVDCQGQKWFERLSFRIRLVAGTAAPQFDAATRVLTVQLPPSTVATVRVSSKVTFDENLHGILSWCRAMPDVVAPEQLTTILDAAKANRHWMITPWRELTLGHAVQRPMQPPVLEIQDSGKIEGSTSARLFGNAKIHQPSTARLDVSAEWTETLDELNEEGPREAQFAGPVFEVPLALAIANAEQGGQAADVSTTIIDAETMSFNAAVKDPAGPAPHEFGDTKRRIVRYQPTLTSAFSPYFPAGTDCSLSGQPFEISIPSSARPAAPKLLYVIPTVKWEQTEPAPGQVVRRRLGGGLRVYLDRPWFSSGEGEVLGVVVLDPSGEPKEVERQWMTLLGSDPIRHGSPPRPLDRDTFRNANSVTTNQFIPQIGPLDSNSAVVCYMPEYDPQTRRWFCDLEMDVGSAYFPFVRLALVRFQLECVADLFSPIVLADPVQVLPDRTLTVHKGPQAWRISVTGPAYIGSETTPPGRVFARWEQRMPLIADEDLGWEPVSTVELTLDLPEQNPLIGTWSGDLPVLASPPPRLRLAVVEEEQQAADDPALGIVGRVVYSDTIPV